MKRRIVETKFESAQDQAIKEAADRIYRKYGTDLHRFFRDVDTELTLKREGCKTCGSIRGNDCSK